jgi:hypothetical protein
MARFNLADYETVEERLKRAHAMYEDLRVVTEWESSYAIDGASPNIWVVKASIYLTAGDQANKLPKATGYAVELDGTGGANNGSALENAETSAIGRALANMNLSGNKRSSREEMQKVQRIQSTDWVAEATKLVTVAELRKLYAKANVSGAKPEELNEIKRLADSRNPAGKPAGSSRGVSAGKAAGSDK